VPPAQIPRDAFPGDLNATSRADPPVLPPQILDGPAIENQLSLLNFLPTGCDGVDELLGGGLRQGQVTELTGEAGTGKTQLCLSAAASAAALGHRVVYVDTGGCFSASRVKAFHRGFVTDDADSAEVEQHLNLTLDLITVVKAHDVYKLFKVLEELGCGLCGDAGARGDGLLEGDRELLEYGSGLGLLVVDSLSQLLSPVLTRMHHQGYTAMASVGAALRALAPAHNCAVLYTNHTVGAGAGVSDALVQRNRGENRGKPALGIRWTSTPHRRLCLTRQSMGAGGSCGAEVIYGPGTGSACAFQVVGDGIRTL
jgi:RAD51-like protein 3